METFEETLQRMAAMGPEERQAFVDENRQKCIYQGCPMYNDCMKDKDELLYCIVRQSSSEAPSWVHLPSMSGHHRPRAHSPIYCADGSEQQLRGT